VARFDGLCPSGVVLYFEDPTDGWEGLFFLVGFFVIDFSAEAPTIDLVLVGRDFSDMFLVAEHVVGQGC